MGLANFRHARQWQDNIIEALEGCMYRRDWGGKSTRVIKGIDRTAGRGLELHPSEVTVEGTNDLGEFRRSARQNATIEAFLSPGRTGTPDIPGVGQRPRQIGQTAIKAGKDKTSAELAAQAGAILQREKNQGHYKGITFGKLAIRQVAHLIRETGVAWPGISREEAIKELNDEERKKIDDEIKRQCREQAKKTTDAPQGFFRKVERYINEDFPCCGEDGQETLEKAGYKKLNPNYVHRICIGAKILKVRQTTKEQIADPDNRKKVADAIKIHGPHQVNIGKQTGLSEAAVRGILEALGYITVGSRVEAIRKIILPLHDDEKLTVAEMWDHSEDLRVLLPGSKDSATKRIHSYLLHSDPPRQPWTQAKVREDRVLPIVADNLREMLRNHLRQEAQNEEWLTRIRRNVSAQTLPGGIFEPLGTEQVLTVDGAAALIKETPAFTRKVIEVLAAETPQFVAIRGEELVIPFSGLQWIARGEE
jgi:hypothetical protein